MPQKSTGISMKNHSDYVWDIYETTPIMSTYTIAMAVLSSNFTYHVRQYGSRNISVISISYSNETIERMLTSTDKYVRLYETYYNNTDSVPKIDNLEATAGAYGAMENWGMIIYFKGNNYPLLIAHEVAHYWHGNKVTCSNWHE